MSAIYERGVEAEAVTEAEAAEEIIEGVVTKAAVAVKQTTGTTEAGGVAETEAGEGNKT